ncbi:MAG: glycosyltransferase family 2 protein [Bacteroidota bacterium]|nr:glycosyltransferase family 2 protein [Bacteroidota bacterium]
MKNRFSVVIPVFNKEKYIKETILSVFNQTYDNYEIIIINDASTDNSLKIIEEVISDKAVIINNKNNLGLSASRNIGFEASSDKFVAFLDGDDVWDKNFLKEINELIINFPKESIFGTYYKENYDGKILYPKINIKEKLLGTKFVVKNFFEANLRRLIITQSCLVFKKNIFDTVGLYNPEITFAEDIDFYIRCFQNFNLAYSYQTYHMQRKMVHKSISNSKTDNLNYPLLDKYLGVSDELNRFINFYNYCFCRRKKNEGSKKSMIYYRNKIRFRWIGFLKTIVLFLPEFLYTSLLKFKRYLLKKGINISTY